MLIWAPHVQGSFFFFQHMYVASLEFFRFIGMYSFRFIVVTDEKASENL